MTDRSAAAAMREEAAKVIEDNILEWDGTTWSYKLVPRNAGNQHELEYADAIRAISLPADEPAPQASVDAMELLEKYEDAALNHGWYRDQGSRRQAENAEREFDEARAAFLAAIAGLQKGHT